MEPRVLYEAAFELDFALLVVPLLFVAAVIVFLVFAKKKRDNAADRASKTGIQIGMIFSGGLAIQLALFTAILIFYHAGMYQATVRAYQRGEYQTVEGYVTEFDPMPATGHARGSFTINGVCCAYSDFESQSGYHNARSLGGVITGDGQHLKIGYTEFFGRNVIVYIEELP